MDLERLRNETRSEHHATEDAISLMDPGLTTEQYVLILQRLHRIIRGWEQWAHLHAPAELQGLVTRRARAHLLEQDLHSLGASIPDETTAFPAEQIPGIDLNDAGFLGAMYVVEGSTLGGRYIARHIEKTLGLKAGVGDSYFRGHEERTHELWSGFKRSLAELPEGDSETVILAAKAMFGVFRRGLLS